MLRTNEIVQADHCSKHVQADHNGETGNYVNPTLGRDPLHPSTLFN